MVRMVVAAGLVLIGLSTAQADESCKMRAGAKKLAGAALTSFMTKCQKDATASCDASATSRKLAGAARASFTKKCVSDAVGT
jgi:hypothetical protein